MLYTTLAFIIYLFLTSLPAAFAEGLNDNVNVGGPMQIQHKQAEQMGHLRFVERIAEMLRKSITEVFATDRDQLNTKVTEALDEALGHGIKTERLIGMYVILRLSDKIAPYEISAYAKILRDPTLEEDDKAHLIQMVRIGVIAEIDGQLRETKHHTEAISPSIHMRIGEYNELLDRTDSSAPL